MATDSTPVKIRFRFYSDMMEQEAEEILIAEMIDVGLGQYKISSIPFYVEGIATEDIVMQNMKKRAKCYCLKRSCSRQATQMFG